VVIPSEPSGDWRVALTQCNGIVHCETILCSQSLVKSTDVGELFGEVLERNANTMRSQEGIIEAKIGGGWGRADSL